MRVLIFSLEPDWTGIARLRGEHWRPETARPLAQLVAFFPEEWWRDPDSPFLHSTYHDVPWNDPPLLRYCVERGPTRAAK
jgi:hypothetical protein